MGYTEPAGIGSLPLLRAEGLSLSLEILEIRDVPPTEFTPLVEAESHSWFQDLHWDFSASARVVFSLLQERRLSGFALRRDGRLAGYCFYFIDGAKGLIGDLFVASRDASAEEAAPLLDRAVGALMNASGIRRIEAQLPHFRHHVLSTWFRPRFFDGYVRLFMAMDLEENVPWLRGASAQTPHQSASALGRDFRLDEWKRNYDSAAARLLSRAYHGHVDAVINNQYGSLDGATRLIENIVHLRGCGEFLQPASLVLIHRPTDQVAGLLGMTAVRGGTAHIAQVAVAAEFQKAGLGRTLIQTAMRRVLEQGFGEVSLTVTSLNSGAVRLYERLGFKVLRDFGAFVWKRP